MIILSKKIEEKRWGGEAFDYIPVGMYELHAGLSYSTLLKIGSSDFGSDNRWGLIDKPVKEIDYQLLINSYGEIRRDYLVGGIDESIKKIREAYLAKYKVNHYYFGNPAFPSVFSNRKPPASQRQGSADDELLTEGGTLSSEDDNSTLSSEVDEVTTEVDEVITEDDEVTTEVDELLPEGKEFQNADKLKTFYRHYAEFLVQIDQKSKLFANALVQKVVAKDYYYPKGLKSLRLTPRDITSYSKKLVELARTSKTVGEGLEFPYIIVNSPDSIDRQAAWDFVRDLERFNSFSISHGNIPDESLAGVLKHIKYAGSVEFLPADFHQRMRDVVTISKMVINIDKSQIPKMMTLLSGIYHDDSIGFRVLKAVMAGPKFYDKTSQQVAIYFTGTGGNFTEKVNQYFVDYFNNSGLSGFLTDLTPVDMYSVSKGISYSLMSNIQPLPKGMTPYRWGMMGDQVKLLDARLLQAASSETRRFIVKGYDRAQVIDRLKTFWAAEGGDHYYFDNPALYDALGQEFSADAYREALSIITSRMRSLKYTSTNNYQSYVDGLENYGGYVFEEEGSRLIGEYMNASKGSLAETRLSTQKSMLTLLREADSPLEIGVLRGIINAGDESHQVWRDKTVAGNTQGKLLIASDQGRFSGTPTRNCCYVLNLMASKILADYGPTGIVALLEQLNAENEALLRFVNAAGTAFVESSLSGSPQTYSVGRFFGWLLDNSEPESGVIFLAGHALTVAQSHGQIILYDPKQGAFIYTDQNDAKADLVGMIERRYGYYDQSGEEKLIGYSSIKSIVPLSEGALFHQKVVLSDASVSDTLGAFSEQYILGPVLINDPEQVGRIKEGNNRAVLAENEFYSRRNRPILELSELVADTIAGITRKGPPMGAPASLSEPAYRHLFAEQFRISYADYLKQHTTNAPRHVQDIRQARSEIIEAFMTWGRSLIPDVTDITPDMSGTARAVAHMENHRLAIKYMAENDMHIRLGSRLANLDIPESQMILNLPPKQLALFYKQLGDLQRLSGFSEVVHSIKVSALDGYSTSAEPIVFYLRGKGWVLVSYLRDILNESSIIDAGPYWEVEYPGMLNLGRGLHYAEIPYGAALTLAEWEGTRDVTLVSHLNILARIFSNALHDYIMTKNSNSLEEHKTAPLEIVKSLLDGKLRTQSFRLLSLFTGHLTSAGFDHQNLALLQTVALDWEREQRRFQQNYRHFNEQLLLTRGDGYYQQFTERWLQGIDPMLFLSMSERFEPELRPFVERYQSGDLPGLRSIRVFNNIIQSNLQGNRMMIEDTVLSLHLHQIGREELGASFMKNFIEQEGQIHYLNQNALAGCGGVRCLSVVRVAIAALGNIGLSAFGRFSKNINEVTPGDRRFQSFVQALGLMQESLPLAQEIAKTESRWVDMFTIDDIFAEIKADLADSTHYILETQTHAMSLSRIVGADGRTSYIFLDPNFAAIAFSESGKWEDSVKQFLGTDSEFVDAYLPFVRAGDGEPMFRMRRVDDARALARIDISKADNIKISSLFQSQIGTYGGLVSSKGILVTKLSEQTLEASELTSMQRRQLLSDMHLHAGLTTAKKEQQLRLITLNEQVDEVVKGPSLARDRAYGGVLGRAQRFAKGIKALLFEHGLKAGLIPVIGGVEFEYDPVRPSRVTRANIPFMDHRGVTTQVATDNPEIIRFLRDWDNVYKKLHLSYVMERGNSGQMALRPDISATEQLDGLNHLFMVQAVINLFRQQNIAQGLAESTGLAKALEIHHWVFTTQIAYGVIHDGVRFVRIAQALRLARLGMSETAAIEASSILLARVIAKGVRVFEGLGLALLPVYIGLDIYELSQATSLSQRAIFATQLAMDSLNATVTTLSIGASVYASFGLAGAASAASFSALLGGAGVITGGLMIGVFGLASAYAGEYEQVHQVGEYFNRIDSGYAQGGYHYNDESNALVPYPGALILEVNLRDDRLSYGSQTLQSVQHHANATGSGAGNYYFWAGDQATLVKDHNKDINIRQALGYDATVDLPAGARAAAALILPATPNNYISYPDGWAAIPGITSDHSTGLDVLRRLEGEHFDFDYYMFPMERAIKKVLADYSPVTVTVKLDAASRQLMLADFNTVNSNQIDYDLRGQDGEYQLVLGPGARSITLLEDGEGSTWYVSSSQGAESISVAANSFTIDNITVKVSSTALALAKFKVLVSDEVEDVFVLNFNDQSITALSENLTSLYEQEADQEQLLAHLQALKKDYTSGRTGSYIVLRNYRTDARDSSTDVGTAYYDVSNDRILYTNRPEQKHSVLDQATLVADNPNSAFFMGNPHSLQLWEADVSDGSVRYQYQDGFTLGHDYDLSESTSATQSNGDTPTPGSAPYGASGCEGTVLWCVLFRPIL